MKLIDHLVAKTARWAVPVWFHWLIAGASGTGKTGAAEVQLRAELQDGRVAVVLIDPEGELTQHLTEFAANPANNVHQRIHVLKPASPTHSFGLPFLDVQDRDPQACHEAAVRVRTVLEQVMDFGAGEFGPRTSKMLHLGAYALARAGKPLVALPEIYGSMDALRASLGEAFNYQFMSDEWSGLDELAARNLRAFIDYRDPVVSRLLPLFGSPQMRRTFGQSNGHNIDLEAIIAKREAIFLDLSGLEPKDAVLVGTAFFSILYNIGLKSPVTDTPIVSITLEEAADYLTPDVARGLDRLRKRGFFVRLLIQRLAQCQKRSDPNNALLSAVLTNCLVKIIFGGLEPDDAELMARLLFTGHLELDAIYKDASVRPVAIGQDKITLSSRAAGRHHVQQVARGHVDTTTEARVRALMDVAGSNWGSMNFAGQSAGSSSLPEVPLLSAPTPTAFNRSRNSGAGSVRGANRMRGSTHAFQVGRSTANSRVHGTGDGVSEIAGEHEAFVTRFAELGTESYTLEEKLHAATGLLVNLPPRSCLVKISSGAPQLARTPDLTPAFRSSAFRAQALPLYRRQLEASPYLRPVAEIDAEIAANLAAMREPDVIDADFNEAEPVRLPHGDNRR